MKNLLCSVLVAILLSVTGKAVAQSPSQFAPVDNFIQPENAASFAGRATDSDGTISSYAWTKISGGSATFINANTSTLNVTGLEAGKYTFRLTVTDNKGAVATDDVNLTVTKNSAQAASTPSDSIDMESLSDENGFSFMDQKYPAGYNYAIAIFDKNGEKMFHGKWSSETYQEVTQTGKAYMYQVIQNGRKIDSGRFRRVE